MMPLMPMNNQCLAPSRAVNTEVHFQEATFERRISEILLY
jgi:hypothetical protein